MLSGHYVFTLGSSLPSEDFFTVKKIDAVIIEGYNANDRYRL